MSKTNKHQVGVGYGDHELTRGNERGLLRGTVPEHDRIRAEIVPTDRHRKGHAVYGRRVRHQRGNGWRRKGKTYMYAMTSTLGNNLTALSGTCNGGNFGSFRHCLLVAPTF